MPIKQRDISLSWIGRLNIIKIASLQLKFNAILIKIPIRLFYRNKQYYPRTNMEKERN